MMYHDGEADVASRV